MRTQEIGCYNLELRNSFNSSKGDLLRKLEKRDWKDRFERLER